MPFAYIFLHAPKLRPADEVSRGHYKKAPQRGAQRMDHFLIMTGKARIIFKRDASSLPFLNMALVSRIKKNHDRAKPYFIQL
jgi:hypothetical protein